MGIKYEYTGMRMGIEQWEWQGIGILIVFSQTSSSQPSETDVNARKR